MKAKDIKVGGVYAVKVGGRVVPCEVRSEKTYTVRGGAVRGSWLCRSQVTGYEFTVKSAQKFRSEVAGTVNGYRAAYEARRDAQVKDLEKRAADMLAE